MLLAILVFVSPSLAAETISQPDRWASTGSRESLNPQFTDDDQTCVFVSLARNLTSNDVMTPWLNVYARTLSNSVTELISARNQRLGGGDGNSSNPDSSADGQWIAFQSEAGDLLEAVSADTNRVSDIYLRDRPAGITSLISVSTNGTAGNGPSKNPRISADGRFVVFESAASDLVADDTNRVVDIFIRDRLLGTTRLVSVTGDAGPVAGNCELTSITPDARRVAFVRSITSLSPITLTPSEAYVRDLTEGRTLWLSAGVPPPASPASSNECLYPTLSADGRVATFLVADTFRRGQLYRWTEELGAVAVPLGSNAMNAAWTEAPALSRDGRYIAAIGNDYSAYLPNYDSDAFSRSHTIFLYDAARGTAEPLESPCEPLPPESCRSPVFSLDGTHLAFLRSPAGGPFDRRLVIVWKVVTNCLERDSFVFRGPVEESVPALSSNGQMVAYESDDATLVSQDFNQATDIFLSRRGVLQTRAISARAVDRPALTGHRPAMMSAGASSADGSSVVFASYDNQLVAGDMNPWIDIFVRDRAGGRTLPASSFIQPPSSNTTYRSHPAISADGQFVAFREDLTNIIWVDLQTQAAKRLRNASLSQYTLWPPLLSPDGRYVYIESREVFLRSPPFTRYDLWALDVPEITARTVSPLRLQLARLSPNGLQIAVLFPSVSWFMDVMPFPSIAGGTKFGVIPVGTNTYRPIDYWPPSGNLTNLQGIRSALADFAFSANSRFIFFFAQECCNTPVVSLRHDLEAPLPLANTIICTNCLAPSPRGDGLEVAVEMRRSSLTSSVSDIYAIDLVTGARDLINVTPNGSPASGTSYSPVMSHDGRYVAFLSRASNLVANDPNNLEDLFVRDRWTSTTLIVSSGAGAPQAYSAPLRLQLSPDGRTVLYQSFRYDHDADDYNLHSDVFALQLDGVDSDGDGLEDGWEMAYFDTLARDGKGDFDEDGVSDRQEYRSGTDPTNRGSVFKVLAVTRVGSGSTQLLWVSTPGGRYQVETKASPDTGGWTPIGLPVTAAGTTTTLLDTSSPPSVARYYRVMMLP